VINVSTLSKLRRLVLRQDVSVREASRRLGISRNTATKWLKDGQMAEPRYPQRVSGPSILDPYKEQLGQWLKADSHRSKRDRRGIKAMFEALRAQGYRGSRGPVYAFAQRWQQEQGNAARGAGFVPLSFELGEAFQFDWSCEYLFIGGLRRRLEVAHTKLAASRAFCLVAYYSQAHEMLFDAHARAFALFGGVPRRGIYDNMKTAVDKVGQGKQRSVNARFEAMTGHYLFEPEFCNRAAGWEKGVVEKNVQDRRKDIWREASERRWSSLNELNDWLQQACVKAWAEMKRPRSSRHGADLVADLLQAPDEAVGGLGGVLAVEVGSAQIVPFGAVLEHVPCGREHGGGHGDDGLLGASSRSDAMELRLQVASLDSYGRPGGLHQRGLEPLAAAAQPGAAALAGALVVARTQAGPGQQVARRGKAAHVDADLGDQRVGGDGTDARNLRQSLGGFMKGLERFANTLVHLLDLCFEHLDRAQVGAEQEPVMLLHAPCEPTDQHRALGLQALLGQIREPLGVGLSLGERSQDGAPADTEKVGDQARDLEVGVFEHLLDAQRVLGHLAHELLARARQVAHLLNGLRRNEAAADQAMRQQVGDPRGVIHVRLATGHGLDVSRVGQQ
jgi:transposase